MASIKKKEQVESVKALIKATPNFALIGFKNIKHQNLEELRKTIKKFSSRLKVVKNSLVKKAFNKINIEDKKYKKIKESTNNIQDKTAILLIENDYSSPLKAILDYSKNDENISFKFGFLDGNLYDSNELNKIAALPSVPELISKIIYTLKSPVNKIYYSLQSPMSKFVNILKSEKLTSNKEVSNNGWRK